jgi:hypothetical protein
MSNPNKTFHCNAKSITVYYTDSKKHFISSYHSEKVNNLQIHGNSPCSKGYQDDQSFHQIENLFTPYQNKLYREAMHGLSIYTGQEIEAMSFKEKLRIEHLHKKAQRILNEWKQSIVSQQVDQLLLTLFPKSPFLKKEIIDRTKDYTNNTITNHHSFSELNITRIDIIRKLIEKKILPEVSHNLKTVV